MESVSTIYALIYRWPKNSSIVTEIMILFVYLNELHDILCRRGERSPVIIVPIKKLANVTETFSNVNGLKRAVLSHMNY